MFYSTLLLDLDNTLYSYNESHNYAISKIKNYLNSKYNIKHTDFDNLYKTISNNLKIDLYFTASSHNRFIYFKKISDLLNLNNEEEKLNQLYWESFLDYIKPFNHVIDFIKWNKSKNIKIGIITNFQTEYQIKKLKKLNIYNLIDNIITSEEVGVEKPHNYIFNYALNIMKITNPKEVILIGDNFDHDITPAINLDIYPFFFNLNGENKINNNYGIFNNYKFIFDLFNELNIELNQLEDISKYCGERFDLVQAGGGNISFKCNNLMFIKSSGTSLSMISPKSGYSIINNTKLFNYINNTTNLDDDILSNYNIINNNKPSIETFMHAILKKYVVHLHPIAINNILIKINSEEIIKELFPNSLFISYIKPGSKLCKSILDTNIYNKHNTIFLQNHGVIYHSDNLDTIYKLIETSNKIAENYFKLDLSKYKLVNKISKICNQITNIKNINYLTEDSIINNYLYSNINIFQYPITFPDALIYCGFNILIIDKLDFSDINNYYLLYNELPKIIILDNNIYINSISLNKCKEIEAVLKANLLILDNENKRKFLSHDEIQELNNWDAEKYRKNLL